MSYHPDGMYKSRPVVYMSAGLIGIASGYVLSVFVGMMLVVAAC